MKWDWTSSLIESGCFVGLLHRNHDNELILVLSRLGCYYNNPTFHWENFQNFLKSKIG